MCNKTNEMDTNHMVPGVLKEHTQVCIGMEVLHNSDCVEADDTQLESSIQRCLAINSRSILLGVRWKKISSFKDRLYTRPGSE